MATFTITAAQNIDALTTKAGGDTYNINGGTLTIDQDTRYGQNTTTTTGGLGPVTISPTLGGTLEIDARDVRMVRYDTGSGNVPAGGTTITDATGGGSGKLIAVSLSLTSAPTAAGAAMPASGYIKIKQWNGQDFGSGNALTGIGANVITSSNETVRHFPGWISLVGDEASLITGARKGLIRIRGALWHGNNADNWVTSGSNATTWQLPTFGEAVYLPGCLVEVDVDSDIYEWYPNMGNQSALLATIGTEAARGKVCWISSTGVLRFGHDGTNSTGGYVPPADLNIRIPNIYMHSATTAARGTNAVPNSTLATRYEFAAAGAQIEINIASSAWYFNLNQAYSIALTDVGVNDTIVCGELATAATWSRVCVAPTQAQSNTALALSLGFAGGTISNSVFARYSLASSGNYVASVTDCDGWTFDTCEFRMCAGTRGNATSGAAALTRANNCEFLTHKNIGGRFYLTQCANVLFENLSYIDVPASTTPTGNPMYAVDTGGGGCTNIKLDGLDFAALPMVQPYSGLMQVGVGGSFHRIRNIGTAATPLDLGAARVSGASWSRSTTTATVTSTAHGLKNNDTIYVIVSSDTAAITVAAKTITVTGVNTFTFTCLNAGGTNGSLSYYPQISAYVIALASNSAASDIYAQRCYTTHTRTGAYTTDNSAKRVYFENLWGDAPHAPVTSILDGATKGLVGNHALTAQTNPVYGTHWINFFTTANPANVSGVSWSRSSTTITVTSTGHGLRTGDRVLVSVSSAETPVPLGVKSITATTADAFTFTGVNSGSSSGTLTFSVENGKIALLMNESSAASASQISVDAGTPGFTAAGTVYMPAVNDQITWTMPYYALGHTGFPIDEAVLTGGTITNYDITYQIDKNDGNGFSAWKNLSYPRAGGGGSTSSTNVTMTDTTGVAVNDYVFGTNIAPLAKVSSITNGTTIVVSIANVGTVSGILRFNQLPNEASIVEADGVKLKFRIKTTTVNTSAVSSLYVWTNSPDSARDEVYPLDTITLTIVAIVPGSDVVIYQQGTENVLASFEPAGSTCQYQYQTPEDIDIGVFKAGYVPYYIRYYVLGSSNASVPVQQTPDRGYLE